MRLASSNSSIASVIPLSTVPPRFPPEWPSLYAAAWSGCQNAHVEGADRPMQAFEIEFAKRFELGNLLDRDLDPAIDQDLPVTGVRAQARTEIDHRAVRRIVETPLIADVSQRRMAGRDADPETQLVTIAAPSLGKRRDVAAHFNRHAHCAHRRIGTRNRIVEDDQEAVAGEVLQGAFKAVDRFAETAIIFLQHRDDVFRLGVFGKCGEAAKIAEHGGNVAPVALQQLLVRDHNLGDLWR